MVVGRRSKKKKWREIEEDVCSNFAISISNFSRRACLCGLTGTFHPKPKPYYETMVEPGPSNGPKCVRVRLVPDC